MLVLSRKSGESIVVGNNIVVTVLEMRGDRVRLGLAAPRDVSIRRAEIVAALPSQSPVAPLQMTVDCSSIAEVA